MLGFLILALIGVFWLQAKLKSIKPAETSSLSGVHGGFCALPSLCLSISQIPYLPDEMRL